MCVLISIIVYSKKKKVCENLQNERNSQDESKMILVLEMSSGN